MPNLFPTQNAGGTAVAEPEEATEIVVNLDEEISVADPTEDINTAIALPPAGVYVLKTGLLEPAEGKENPYASATRKEHKPFVVAGLDLKIVDEGSDFHDFQINQVGTGSSYINTLIPKGRKTSPLHWFMNCIGEVLPQTISVRGIINRVKAAFAGNPPLVHAEIDWKASRKSGDGKYDYEVVAWHMKDFPKNPEGDGHSQIYLYKDKATGQVIECRAVAYVSKFLNQQ